MVLFPAKRFAGEEPVWVLTGSYWYYVGADGVMLTDTTTPDGYYVDGDGIWRK